MREGAWARPDNLDRRRLPHLQAVVDGQCLRFFRAVGPVEATARLFDLEGWAARADTLGAAMAEATTAFDATGPADLAGGFLLSIAVVRHLEADPVLPGELLPPDWPGARLREQYQRYDEHYKRRLARSLAP